MDLDWLDFFAKHFAIALLFSIAIGTLRFFLDLNQNLYAIATLCLIPILSLYFTGILTYIYHIIKSEERRNSINTKLERVRKDEIIKGEFVIPRLAAIPNSKRVYCVPAD